MASNTHKSKCTNSVQPPDPDEGGRRRSEVTEGAGWTARGGRATSLTGGNGRHEAKRGAARKKLWWDCANARRKSKMHAVGSRHAASQVSLRASSPVQRSLIRINYLSESSSSTAVSGVQSGQAVFPESGRRRSTGSVSCCVRTSRAVCGPH